MAAVIRAPCLCLWCLPGVASVPCVLPCRPDPQLEAAVENFELFLRPSIRSTILIFCVPRPQCATYYVCLCRFQTRSDLIRAYSLAIVCACLLLRPDFKLGYCAACYSLTTPLDRHISLSSSLSGAHPTWTFIGT